MMSFWKELLFFQSCGSLSFSGQVDSTIFLQRLGALSMSLSSPPKCSSVETICAPNKNTFTEHLQQQAALDPFVLLMPRPRRYLDGSPGVGGEEGHGADGGGLHGKSQQEVKLLHINLALLEQNLKCVCVGVCVYGVEGGSGGGGRFGAGG